MLFFFVDESGTGLKDKGTPHFILAAFAVPAETLAELEDRIASLKRLVAPTFEPEDFELKGREILSGRSVFRSHSREQRVEILEKLAELALSLPGKVLAVRVDKRELPLSDFSEADLYRVAFTTLLDALQSELEASGRPGLILMDARSDLHSAVQDRRTLDAFLRWANNRTSISFASRPWFGFSHFYAGLQMVDVLAYLISSGERIGPLHRLNLWRTGGKVVLLDIP